MTDALLRIVKDIERRYASRLDALEARFAPLEQRPELKFYGPWEPRAYPKGALIQHGGSAWYARRDTTSAPGKPEMESRDWVLLVKHGRDGRDGKDARA